MCLSLYSFSLFQYTSSSSPPDTPLYARLIPLDPRMPLQPPQLNLQPVSLQDLHFLDDNIHEFNSLSETCPPSHFLVAARLNDQQRSFNPT
ncbi:hypothetical protein K402DRAFT_398995 [Aulographum hederae CBS 113979]|uniref:Uncharacterized protein n=1 Tax=Aulographum hederae CBS 113979 TaxID=1176131 RepID=A0A6G1GJB8_9PEZI|nr:hypothetical protein K402DRAFT_398995 [Aulographum hederae CBS 113979]